MASRRLAAPRVTVILGDPSLPDPTKVGDRFNADDLEAVNRMKEALGELAGYSFTYIDHHDGLLSELVHNPPALVLNLCDTGYKNQAFRELHIPALLELLEVPYTGSGPACLALCYDKALVRAAAADHGVPVPIERYLGPRDPIPDLEDVLPVIVKPNTGDGSIGITRGAVVHNVGDARACVDRLRRELPDRAILIQQFLEGPEYGASLIGNPGLGFTLLPPLEVDYGNLDRSLPPILSYESKTVPESPYWTQIKYRQARVDRGVRRRLNDYCALLFGRLGCRDYARFDFRADSTGQIKLLEVNPNPAWCWDGKLNMMAGFAGYRYSDLFRLILEAAQTRIAKENG